MAVLLAHHCCHGNSYKYSRVVWNHSCFLQYHGKIFGLYFKVWRNHFEDLFCAIFLNFKIKYLKLSCYILCYLYINNFTIFAFYNISSMLAVVFKAWLVLVWSQIGFVTMLSLFFSSFLVFPPLPFILCTAVTYQCLLFFSFSSAFFQPF